MTEHKSVQYEVVKNKAFSIMFTTIETESMDLSTWTEEQLAERKTFICTLHAQTYKHTDKSNDKTILLLSLTKLDTVLECRDWAQKQWDSRKEGDWYHDFCKTLKDCLKDRYHSLIER